MNLRALSGKKVFVGLSGGVDSGVTAALLKDVSAKVTGVFLKGWYPPGMPCTWQDDRRDAMRVAAHLRIPFRMLDLSFEYKRGVIDYLVREYRAGRTPNPDVMCNREVKFGAFYGLAKDAGAILATGHYARIEDGELLRGIDPAKDQSYFLWAVAKEALLRTVFPLGRMRKTEVRKLALKYGLPNAQRRDSQGICFLGSISIEDFLKNEMDPSPGKALDTEGGVVGEHAGALLYTLGERIALRSALPGPWYALAKDLAANTITVSKSRAGGGTQRTIELTDTNWLAPVPEREVEAQYRYHGPRVTGTLKGKIFTPNEVFPEPVAPGQSLVLYEGDLCLGGGIIA